MYMTLALFFFLLLAVAITHDDLILVFNVQLTFAYFRKLPTKTIPVETGRKLNVLCTFNLRPVSTGILAGKFVTY